MKDHGAPFLGICPSSINLGRPGLGLPPPFNASSSRLSQPSLTPFFDEKAAHLKYNDCVLQFDSWENDVG